MDSFLEEFIEKKGRRPKILHLGNTANNAYQNAKILIREGYDCDVMEFLNFHANTCPEWEDAIFNSDEIDNAYYPDWRKIELHGFKRPYWFAQSSLGTAADYLIKRRTNKKIGVILEWNRMEWERSFLSRYHSNKPIWNKIREFSVPLITEEKIQRDNIKKRQEIEKRISILFKEKFPELPIIKVGDALKDYIGYLPKMEKLFRNYDIIQAYGENVIWPFLINSRPYVAFEHGTLREIDQKETPLQRLILLSYANANITYVTNVDNAQIARYLMKEDESRIVYGLHGINIPKLARTYEKVKSREELRKKWGFSNEEKIYFFPGRHDREGVEKNWLKGENKIIEAFTRLAETRAKFKLILIRKGHAKDELERLLNANEKLCEKIYWLDWVNRKEYLELLKISNMVIGQFFTKTFGGIEFEALCTGDVPLCTGKVSDEIMKVFFGEQLPTFNCENVNDIYKAIEMVFTNPKECEKRARYGKRWILLHHSYHEMIRCNEEAYKKCKVL